MVLLRRLLFQAARRIAADPRVQDKAAEFYQGQVRPRAQAAARETGSRLKAARDELRDIAAETDPRDDPKGFANKVKRRFLDGEEDGEE